MDSATNRANNVIYTEHSIHIGDNVLGDLIKHYTISREPLPEIDLEQAKQLLNALPTEIIPPADKAKVPPWSRMTPTHQPYFVGRDHELMQLATQLKFGTTSVISTGIGGVGKSTLASEFAYRYGAYFAGGVFWISFADANQIESEIADCGARLHLFHEHEELTLEQRVARVYTEWQKPVPRLIIFDNCDDLSHDQSQAFLQKYLPKAGGSRVLITSRNSLWQQDQDIKVFQLAVLKREKSIELLRKYRADLSEEDADTIAEELGDLPLALSLAGNYLAKYAGEAFGKPAKYLENLRKKKLDHKSINDEERGVRAAFDLSFQRLDTENSRDAMAIQLLSRASHFAPNTSIWKQMLYWTTGGYDPEDEEEALPRADALQRLLELGLLEQEDHEDVHIHRLVAEYCHQTLSGTEAQEQVELVVIHIINQLVQNKIPSDLLPFLPHLYHCYQAIEQQNTLRNAKLAIVLGDAEQEQNNYSQAETFYLQALHINETIWGSEHLDTTTSLNNLALLYKKQGRYSEAESLYQRALNINETLLGDKHLITSSSLNNLADIYHIQARYREAEPIFLRALSIRETELGANDPKTATTLNNLALLYTAQNRYEEAEPLFLRALSIRETILGPKHPDVAQSLNNLALLYTIQRRYDEAEPIYQRALEIDEMMLGVTHPTTAATLNNLANLYTSQKKYEEAEPLFLRSLSIRETILGSEHPDVAHSLNSLTNIYISQMQYGKAEPLFLRALNINEVRLGLAHPSTVIALNNLAYLHLLQGRYGKAEQLYIQALGNNQTVLGEKFSNTQDIYRGLEFTQYLLKQLEQAQTFVEQALNDTSIDRQILAKNLQQTAQQWESNGPESPWYAAAAQLRELIVKLDLENYTPPSQEEQIATVLAQAQADVKKALNDPSIDRQALLSKLEASVQYIVEREKVGSPWYVFAEQLRALAAQLRNA